MHPNDHLKIMIGDLVMQLASTRAQNEALTESLKKEEVMPNSRNVSEPDYAGQATASEAAIREEGYRRIKAMREKGEVSDADWARQTADPAFSAWLEGNG